MSAPEIVTGSSQSDREIDPKRINTIRPFFCITNYSKSLRRAEESGGTSAQSARYYLPALTPIHVLQRTGKLSCKETRDFSNGPSPCFFQSPRQAPPISAEMFVRHVKVTSREYSCLSLSGLSRILGHLRAQGRDFKLLAVASVGSFFLVPRSS